MLFSGTSELLLRIVKPHLNSSDDFSSLYNSSQRRSVLHTSSWLSSTLFSSLSSPPNGFELVLAHLSSVPPVHFLLSPVEVTQLHTFVFRPVEVPFLSIMVFNIWLCYQLLRHVLSFNPSQIASVMWQFHCDLPRMTRKFYTNAKYNTSTLLYIYLYASLL